MPRYLLLLEVQTVKVNLGTSCVIATAMLPCGELYQCKCCLFVHPLLEFMHSCSKTVCWRHNDIKYLEIVIFIQNLSPFIRKHSQVSTYATCSRYPAAGRIIGSNCCFFEPNKCFKKCITCYVMLHLLQGISSGAQKDNLRECWYGEIFVIFILVCRLLMVFRSAFCSWACMC